MKKLISALSVLLLGFMYSGCTENSPTQVSEDQDRTAIEDGSFVAGDVAALGKKCTPKPECNKEGDNSSGVEYEVKVEQGDFTIVGDDVKYLESFCRGLASNKLNATWFTSDCFVDGILGGVLINPNLPPTSFDYTTDFTNTDGDEVHFKFAGNGSLFIDVRKKTYRFWLWEKGNRSDVYETETKTYGNLGEGDLITTTETVNGNTITTITLHIHESLEMCRNKKNRKGCVGDVNFGDVVFEPR